MPGAIERRAFRIRGIVQGVGFRPFLYALARRCRLAGFVRNDTAGVLVEVEGEPRDLDGFAAALPREAPPLARILSLTAEPRPPLGERAFRIEASRGEGEAAVFVSPDVATCDECLRELDDIEDRRAGYPFINCTHCGPRLTIVVAAPYDRARTTMASFALCAPCRAEYEDPLDRRYHAQPVACAECGPRLSFLDARGEPATGDAVAAAARALDAGAVVAVKGLGGFHLACDAAGEPAVARLRARKNREEKPFAIMVADLDAARSLVAISDAARELLAAPERPIVLLRRREGARVAPSVAPGTRVLGVMLPYTPLHHLLMRAVGRPLVLTSGNRAGEPIAFEDSSARERLGAVADAFLTHDRPIQVRCDDSVVRADGLHAIPFRRSRGYAPAPLSLPHALARPTLALGGHLKATFALGVDTVATPSHHLGDLECFEAERAYADAIAHYVALLRLEPARLVHDRHPDYASTRYALDQGGGAERVAVQHHHAHMASCMAENGIEGDAIGVVWDGAGLGDDGAIWGGEFLAGGYAAVERVAHWAYVPQPGGERATHEPWRMAVAHLLAAGLDVAPLRARIDERTLDAVAALAARGVRSPSTSSALTSSAGRLFDAVASLAAKHDRVTFEGQAAIALEALAAEAPLDGEYPFDLGEGDPVALDARPLIRAIVADLARGVAPARIARRFHATLAAAIAAVCARVRERTGLARVVLSGGVFMNALLSDEATARLEALRFEVHRHRLVPPNDGGLALGQLAIAAGLDAAARR